MQERQNYLWHDYYAILNRHHVSAKYLFSLVCHRSSYLRSVINYGRSCICDHLGNSINNVYSGRCATLGAVCVDGGVQAGCPWNLIARVDAPAKALVNLMSLLLPHWTQHVTLAATKQEYRWV